jgi:Ca2+-binding EF-hand superfamily protein
MTIHHRLTQGIAACGVLALLSGCTTGDAFTRLDANRDGSGSPQEFDAYMKREIFACADANHDGKVTQKEWQDVNPKLEAARFRKADRNGDGYINRKEADATFDREGSLKKLFKQIDTNGNGSLSHAEVTAYRSKIRQAPGATSVRKPANPVRS